MNSYGIIRACFSEKGVETIPSQVNISLRRESAPTPRSLSPAHRACLRNQATSGVLTGEAAHTALLSLAERVDQPVVALAKEFASPPKGPEVVAAVPAVEEGARRGSGSGGGVVQGTGDGEGEAAAAAMSAEGTAAPSADVQSVLADLGRAALKVWTARRVSCNAMR